MNGALLLENGTFFKGELFGYLNTTKTAEVVFNTGMVGYQEVLTDPSYKGQVVVMTYPLMGNYGLNQEDEEGHGPSVSGFVVREACSYPSNWRMQESLNEYLKRHEITGLAGVDTRSLTKIIREKGTMKGLIVALEENEVTAFHWELLKKGTLIEDPVSLVTTKESYVVPGGNKRIVVMDFGIKLSILENLKALNLELVVVPSHTSAAEIKALCPDGIFLSNGPGDPKAVLKGIETVKALCREYPIFGICLGHQILALALGGDTYKLKFGHRGINHPVKDLLQNRVCITAQNHGYAVKAESLGSQIQVTHVNLNDGTIEGLAHRELPLMSVQYHPEAYPGPEDSRYLFQQYLDLLDARLS